MGRTQCKIESAVTIKSLSRHRYADVESTFDRPIHVSFPITISVKYKATLECYATAFKPCSPDKVKQRSRRETIWFVRYREIEDMKKMFTNQEVPNRKEKK